VYVYYDNKQHELCTDCWLSATFASKALLSHCAVLNIVCAPLHFAMAAFTSQ